MIKSKIEKFERFVFISDRKYRNYSDYELNRIAKLLRFCYCQKIKDKKIASEYKELFLDSPTMFEIFDLSDMSPREVLGILERQKNWEIEHEKSEQEKETIAERYENVVKAFSYLKKL